MEMCNLHTMHNRPTCTHELKWESDGYCLHNEEHDIYTGYLV
jgi:hypothetical protein